MHVAYHRGIEPKVLLTMLTESGFRSRSNGVRRSVLKAQAASLGVPILFGAATWSEYEAEFLRVGAIAVERGGRFGVFGDLDNEDHRQWVEATCAALGVTALLPLWRRERLVLLRELLAEGFVAQIVAVRESVLPKSLLGEFLDSALLRWLGSRRIDSAGENGEYHTLVIDGPLFSWPLQLESGRSVLRDGVWFLDMLQAPV